LLVLVAQLQPIVVHVFRLIFILTLAAELYALVVTINTKQQVLMSAWPAKIFVQPA